ncbi:MAG: hypothetical protein GX590_08530 [Lentisphaerae bacterium]|nr:hypothetical protein [Lentisphaerota bacterium]
MPSEVWVDDNYTAESCGGHVWGYDAFDVIQDGIDAVADGAVVHVAHGIYAEALTIAKSLALIGDADGVLPCLSLPDGTAGIVAIMASNVTIENLRLVKEDQSADTAMVNIPRGGTWPSYTIAYEEITLRNLVVEKGRRAVSITAGDVTIEDCRFLDQSRDALFINAVAGTTTIQGNFFRGDPATSKKAILFENYSGNDPAVSGTIIVADNTSEGKNNFLVYNQWLDADATVDLQISRNTIQDPGSNAIVIYDPREYAPSFDPASFLKIGGMQVQGNRFSGIPAGKAAVVNPEDPVNTLVVDAASNWWGAADGPAGAGGGSGGAIAGAVDFTPWYSDAALSNLVPYNLRLDSAVIGEHAPIGSVVGQFVVDDDDAGDIHAFRLVDGNGTNDADNASFVVDGATLKTAVALAYARRTSYRIFAEVDDGRGGTNHAALVINVLNENDPPVAGHIHLVAIAGRSLAFDPAAYCQDIDGDSLTVNVAAPPAGLDVAREDGLFGFIGQPAQVGTTVSFAYTVSDGALSAQGLIEIEVVGTDEAYLGKAMKVSLIQPSADRSSCVLRFPAVMPETGSISYAVMQCANLQAGEWRVVSGAETTFIPSSDGYYGEMVVVVPLPVGTPRMFFKIQATLDMP